MDEREHCLSCEVDEEERYWCGDISNAEERCVDDVEQCCEHLCGSGEDLRCCDKPEYCKD